MNTTVEFPHTGKVTTLKFRATGRDGSVMAVTTCKDGKFKLWSLVDDTDIYSEYNTVAKENRQFGCLDIEVT